MLELSHARNMMASFGAGGRVMVPTFRWIALALVLILAACAAPPSSPGRQTEPGAAPAAATARKTIVFGVAGQINAFSLAEVGSGGAGRQLTELWLQGLVTSGLK